MCGALHRYGVRNGFPQHVRHLGRMRCHNAGNGALPQHFHGIDSSSARSRRRLERVFSKLRQGRLSGDDDHRYLVRVGRSHSCYQIRRTRTSRRADYRRFSGFPGVSVGHERRSRFVSRDDVPYHSRFVSPFNGVIEGLDRSPGNSKHGVDTRFRKKLHRFVANRRLPFPLLD